MASRTPESRIFLAAQIGALLVMALFMLDLFLNQQQELESGKTQVQRFNTMMAEHTARSFDAVDILLRELAGELSSGQYNWSVWDTDTGWNYLAERQSRTMPQLQMLLIYDRDGQLRYLSIPNQNKLNKQRPAPFAEELAKHRPLLRFGPYLEENTGLPTYALGHRIKNIRGEFDGYVIATLEPMYLQDFCWPNRLAEEFESVLTNTSGEIIATCRPSDQRRQNSPLGKSSEDILFAGKLRGHLPETGTKLSGGFAISQLQVNGFPTLRMLTAVPERSLLAGWYSRLLQLGTLAFLIIAIILVGGLLMRQQVKKVRSISEELEESHSNLEKRIQAATEQLARQRDSAELSNVAKSRFLAAASHDLRQPMHALSLFSTDLQAQARTGTYRDLPRLAEQIGASTQLLSDLLDSLLDISRLDVAGITPEISRFPLQSIFDRVATAYRPSALNRQQLLRFRVTPLWLESDPAILERMISNLVSNALRYTPQEGRIFIAARKRGDQVLIEIRDSGIGISPENQAAVFAEFYQIGNAAREQHQGLGLGLSIVDRLAQALKVDIGLRSALNRGTLFSLTVKGSTPVTLPLMTGSSENEPKLIYCVGGSEALNSAVELLKNWGYRILHDQAVPTISPDLPYRTIVLSDFHLAEEIRQTWAGNLALIVLKPADTATELLHTLPEGTLSLTLPLRPARLRALLSQLQNTSSKSMP